jgi:hypothetical protein
VRVVDVIRYGMVIRCKKIYIKHINKYTKIDTMSIRTILCFAVP